MTVYIIGQQKLYQTREQAAVLTRDLGNYLDMNNFRFCVVLCPSIVNLSTVSDNLRSQRLELGAQNFDQCNRGPFTGQVALEELLSLNVKFVILGHAEVRSYLSEDYVLINKKIAACLSKSVTPIVCFGETESDRKQGKAEESIMRDVRIAFDGLTLNDIEGKRVLLAYDPPWAIKTKVGDEDTKAADPSVVGEMHEVMRNALQEIFETKDLKNVHILYGGSVNAKSAPPLLKQPQVDGLLVGSASTNVESFAALLQSSEEALSKLELRKNASRH